MRSIASRRTVVFFVSLLALAAIAATVIVSVSAQDAGRAPVFSEAGLTDTERRALHDAGRKTSVAQTDQVVLDFVNSGLEVSVLRPTFLMGLNNAPRLNLAQASTLADAIAFGTVESQRLAFDANNPSDSYVISTIRLRSSLKGSLTEPTLELVQEATPTLWKPGEYALGQLEYDPVLPIRQDVVLFLAADPKGWTTIPHATLVVENSLVQTNRANDKLSCLEGTGIKAVLASIVSLVKASQPPTPVASAVSGCMATP